MGKIQHVCLALSLSMLLALGCNKSEKLNEGAQETKSRQYFVQGEKLYLQHCSNCHQKNGTGLGLVYPPLNNSDFIDNNRNAVICLIRNGIKGELIVNSKNYNQTMPPMPQLSDLEIAEIATYLYNNWDRSKGIIPVQEVTTVLQNCSPSD